MVIWYVWWQKTEWICKNGQRWWQYETLYSNQVWLGNLDELDLVCFLGMLMLAGREDGEPNTDERNLRTRCQIVLFFAGMWSVDSDDCDLLKVLWKLSLFQMLPWTSIINIGPSSLSPSSPVSSSPSPQSLPLSPHFHDHLICNLLGGSPA